jgi:hypothetical protein
VILLLAFALTSFPWGASLAASRRDRHAGSRRRHPKAAQHKPPKRTLLGEVERRRSDPLCGI